MTNPSLRIALVTGASRGIASTAARCAEGPHHRVAPRRAARVARLHIRRRRPRDAVPLDVNDSTASPGWRALHERHGSTTTLSATRMRAPRRRSPHRSEILERRDGGNARHFQLNRCMDPCCSSPIPPRGHHTSGVAHKPTLIWGPTRRRSRARRAGLVGNEPRRRDPRQPSPGPIRTRMPRHRDSGENLDPRLRRAGREAHRADVRPSWRRPKIFRYRRSAAELPHALA